MSVSPSNRNPVGNKLLAALSREEYDRILPHLELVSLSSEQILYEVNQPIEYAYFPIDGVCSLLNIMQDGQGIEAATVGHEGMVGVPLLLGTHQIPMQAISQISGDALRMKLHLAPLLPPAPNPQRGPRVPQREPHAPQLWGGTGSSKSPRLGGFRGRERLVCTP